MQTKKIFSLVGIGIALIVCYFLLPAIFVTLSAFAIGGIIDSGILGAVSGKVGPVVGGTWKGTNYLRARIIPANPQTVSQQNNRDKMSRIVYIAKQILNSIIQVYWDPFYSGMSGYNAFVKTNKEFLADTTFLLSDTLQMSKGTLYPISISSATYNTGTGAISITWVDNSGIGGGLATDLVDVVVFDKNGVLLTMDTEAATRDAELAEELAPAGLTPADIYVFVFLHRGTGVDFTVSNSDGSVCAAP
jgi:hypothetical protein